MKHVFIINPAAGGGCALEIGKKIDALAKSEKLDYIMHYTSAPKEATAVAQLYKNEEYIIYAVGGDGTLLEVVNGLVGSKNKLCVIPAGHGNDFYKAVKHLTEEKVVDVGKINGTYFINVLSFGLDAEVASNTHLFKHKKLIPKSQIYNASIVYSLLKYHFKPIQFILNGVKMTSEFTIVTVCNGKYYGNGYHIGPHAELDDGLFDIYFVDKLSKPGIVGIVPKLRKGTHDSDPRVHKRKASRLKVRSDKPIVCNVDGEVLIKNKFNIKIIPGALTIYNNHEFIKKLFELN